MDLIEPTDWIVGGGGLALIIATFINYIGYGTLWVLIGIAVIALVCVEKFGNVDFPFELGWLYLGLGGLAALLAVIRIIQWLTYSAVARSILGVSFWITFILALLGGAAIAVGGYLRAQNIL